MYTKDKNRLIDYQYKKNIEKIIDGITIKPPPLGVGSLWLLLFLGLSIRLNLGSNLMHSLSKNIVKKNKIIG